jgi:hypothetical protein
MPKATGNVLKGEFGGRRKGSPPNEAALEASFRADLEKSGISPGVARKLGFRIVMPDYAWDLLYPKRAGERDERFTACGYWIPYFNAQGKEIKYGRMRKLSGEFLDDEGADGRYRGPINSLPHLYVPLPLFDCVIDPVTKKLPLRDRLVATEGEKKAALMALSGMATIGMGGVSMLGSKRHNITLAEEFDWFDWPNIDVDICFDSDTFDKESVYQAMYRAGYWLRREKKPRSIWYPRITSDTDAKTALDDYLVQFPVEQRRRAYDRLPRKGDETQEAFARFNEVVQVRKLKGYYNTSTDTFYKHQKEIADEYGVGATVLGPDGKKRVLPISLWFTERDEALTTVMNVVYTPGKPERFRVLPGDEHDTLNQWRPGPLLPTPYKGGDKIAPFLDFLRYLTPSLTEPEREWLLDWMAYPLQNPGKKLMQAVLLWSESHGSGKNTLANILRDIYGAHNVCIINGSSLGEKFNDWMLKQLAIVNEVHLPTYSERLAVMEQLKTAITEDTIDLRRIYMPRVNHPNHINILMTSNHADALMLDEQDRRFFVIEGPKKGAKWSTDQFKTLYRWLQNGGTERVYGYLLSRDLGQFNPYADAPRTAARRAMLRGSDTPLNDLLNLLESGPVAIVGKSRKGEPPVTPDCELFSPERILNSLRRYAKRQDIRLPPNLTVRMVGASLGVRKFIKRRIWIGDDHVTLYALVRPEHWKRQNDDQWRTHVRTNKESGNDE